MREKPRDVFGSVGGRFYENGLARTATGRRRRARLRAPYVRKARPVKLKKPDKRPPVHPFQLIGFFLVCMSLAMTLSSVFGGKDYTPFNLLVLVWGSAFTVLGMQKTRKPGEPEKR